MALTIHNNSAVFSDIDVDETEATVIKPSNAVLHRLQVYNAAIATAFVKLYNSASATVGTTTPAVTMPVPPGVSTPHEGRWRFSSGLSIAATGAIGDSDTTAIGADNDISVVAIYD